MLVGDLISTFRLTIILFCGDFIIAQKFLYTKSHSNNSSTTHSAKEKQFRNQVLNSWKPYSLVPNLYNTTSLVLKPYIRTSLLHNIYFARVRPYFMHLEHIVQIIPSKQVYAFKILKRDENIPLSSDLFTSLRNLLIPQIYSEKFQNHIHRSEKREPNKNVFIYGSDNRIRIDSRKLSQYPFFNVVRLSSGCTGTLLTPSYVLTAAHCVHDGIDFKENMEMLKIQVPHKIRYRIHYAKEIIVPYKWKKSKNIPEALRVAFDYAVIRLNVGVFGRHQFTPLQVLDFSIMYSEKLCFLAFPEKDKSLWKSRCPGWHSRPLFNRNILLNTCDSATGNSGATILVEGKGREAYQIIGVLSSVLAHFTSFSLLTKEKIDDICTIIYPEGKQYGVCTS